MKLQKGVLFFINKHGEKDIIIIKNTEKNTTEK